MSFAFGHLVASWGLGKIYEFFSKNKISQNTWIFLLIGSILPDVDFLLDIFFKVDLHRTFTHSFLFLIVAGLLVYIIFKKPHFAHALQLGILTHLVSDMFYGAGVPIFWPSLIHFSFYSVNYFDPHSFSMAKASASQLRIFLMRAIIDMGIGTMWIFYLWLRKRIKF